MKKTVRMFYQKTIAILVSISFIITILIPKNSFAVTNVNSVSSFIPSSLGKVTSAKFYDSKDLIINIQDLHCHAQTQRNITAILEYLDTEYNIDKIYLEGAYKDINTKWLSDFKKEETGNKILESLVDTGRLSGTEYFSVISNKNEIIAGMEDEKLYKENIKLLGEIIDKRQEIEKVCSELERKINSIKKEYFKNNKEIKKFVNLTEKYKSKQINSLQYYNFLEKLSSDNGVNFEKYPNLMAYINLLKINSGINKNKLTAEIKQYLTELKSLISYQNYTKLLNESNSFKDITNISQKLLILDNTYKISDKLKLNNVISFLRYVELSKNINPIEFMNEEANLTDIIFSKLAKNKYEHEVIFLSYCLPKIRNYFLADITAQNYHKFNELFIKFKKILLSYSSEEIVFKLDRYQNLLSRYYKNNIKRDEIFAKTIVKKKNENAKLSSQNMVDALRCIESNFKGKKIKLVVTGGFHTAGLEKILKNNGISYIVITPKVTENIDKAKEIYADTIKYNANILTNSINIEPLCQESLNVSFPKLLNDIFYLIKQDVTLSSLNNNELLVEINKFVDEHVKILDNDIRVVSWQITEGSLKDKNIKYSVTYLIQKGGKKEIETVEYVYSSINDSSGSISENKFEEAVIFKDLFKSFGEKINLIYKTIIAPIAENFVLLYLPFATTVTVAPYLSAVPFAITAIFGIFVFPLSHLIADYFGKANNKEDGNRTFKKLLVPGALFTGIFLAFLLALPGHSFVAFVASASVHSIYNLFVSREIVKNLPVASIINRFFKTNDMTKEDVDAIVKKETTSQYYKIDLLKQKLFEEYPSNKDVGLYIIENLYKIGALNNNRIIPNGLKVLFNDYDGVKDYFLTIGRYNKKSKIIGSTDDLFYNDLVLLTNNLKKFAYASKINRSNLKKLNNFIKEFDYLLDLAKEDEININEDIFPIIKFLLNDIIEIAYELAQNKQDKEVEFLLNSILPLYEEIVNSYEIIYGKTDDRSIEIIKNIAYEFIQQNNFEAFYTSFKFITVICRTNEKLMYENDNNIKLSVMELFLELIDNLNDSNFSFSSLIDRLRDDDIILSDDDIKNIIKYYRFDSKKENTDFYNFIFDRVITDCDKFDIGKIFIYIYNLDGKNSTVTLNLFLKKLYDFATDERNSLSKRKDVSIYLGQIISFAYEKDEINTKYIDLDKVNSLYNELNINARIFKHSVYLDGLFKEQDGTNFNNMFSFTSLFENINRNLLNHSKIKSKVVFSHIIGVNVQGDTGNEKIIKQFNAWKELVNYNDISLELLNKLYLDAKNGKIDKETIKQNFYIICDDVEKMITAFKDIDVDEKYVGDLKTALGNIKDNFYPIQVEEHVKTLGWEEHRSNLSEISSLNTLINAVHQLSAIQFIQNINKINTEKQTVQKWYLQNDETKIVINNLSDKMVNNEILELIFELFKGSNASFEDIIVYNNELYCTCKINAHSVGIYFNFSPNNKSINISFTESTTGAGNKLRIIYFKKVLENLGFKPGNMPFTLQVSMDETTGINNNTDFVKLTKKVLTLFRYSSALDLLLKYFVYDNRDINDTIDKFKDIFLRGFMWFNYMDDGSYHEFKDNVPISLYMGIEDKERFKNINFILENLNLNPIPQEIIERGFITQENIDKYVNIQLERSFADGRIFINKDDVLSANLKVNLIQEAEDFFRNNTDVSIKQAEVLNFMDSNKFNFEFVDMIGGLVCKNGYIKLTNGNFLSVKVLMKPNGSEIKFAKVEEVDVRGNRIVLDSKQLQSILKHNGYSIPEQIETLSDTEKINRTKLLNENFVHYDTASIFADGISAGKGIYVPVKVNYNKNKIDKKVVWVTPYTTVKDEKIIENSGAIITTTGGKISHASIVTNEFGVPAVNIPNGIWEDTKLYVETFIDDKIESKELKENSILLVNGETGHIFVFDGIENKVLEKLQQYIDKQNINEIVNFIKTNEYNENLNKLLEYIFFQLSGESINKILGLSSISNEAKDKLNILAHVKLKQTEKEIDQIIVNIKNTSDIAVKCALLKNIEQKIDLVSKKQIDSGVLARYEFCKQQVLKESYNYVEQNINTIKFFLGKEIYNITEIRYVLNLIQKVDVINSYFPVAEEYKNLRDKIKYLIEVSEELKNKVLPLIESIKVTKPQSFSEINSEHLSIYGSKATENAKISKLLEKYNGVEVPFGFGISNDFFEESVVKEEFKEYFKEKNNAERNSYDMFYKELEEFIEKYKELNDELRKLKEDENRNKDKIKKIEKEIEENNIKALREGDKIQTIINEIPNDEFKNFLEKQDFNIDENKRYAVRSSGIGEDGNKNSFAGMGETGLNISQYEVYSEILECWKSFYSQRAINYMLRTGQIVRPAVLVQEFVLGEKSGIVFSENKDGNSIISVGYGLGEGIVNSSVPADSIEINNGEIKEYTNVNKKAQILPKENGIGTETKFLEDEIKAKSRALSNNEVKALMKIIKILKKEYEYPIDVEFTIKNGIIYILQVRPITILNDNNIIDTEWYQNYIDIKAASILDNLFSNKVTKFYKYWTIGFAPVIETLFIAIPFVLFATNPFGFLIISVVGFAFSHWLADVFINKTINSSVKIRSLSDITKIAGAGIIFSSVFLAVNVAFPGAAIFALLVAAGFHSIYNYIASRTDILPVAVIYSIQDVQNEVEKLKEKKQNGAFTTALQRDVFNIFDDLYSQDKQLAKEFIKTVYEERIINLDTLTDIKQLSDDYEKFKCCYDAINSNSEIKRTLSYSIEKVNKILEEDKLNDDEDEINVDLPDISKLSNIVSLISKDETLKLLTIITKINLLNLEKAQRIDNRIIKVFSDIAVLMYDKNDNKYFRKVIELTLNLAANIQDDRNFQNKYEPLLNVIRIIDSMKDVNNLVKNENMDFILEQLSNISAEKYVNMIDDLFGTLGINEIVLKYLFKSLSELNEVNFSLDLPIEKTLLYEENISLITDNVNLLDMRFLCLNLYNKDNVFAKQFTQSVINKLQNNIKIEYKIKDSLIALGQIYSAMYEYMDKDNIMGIDEINELFEQNNIDAKLIKNNVYLSNLYDYDKAIYKFDSNYFYGNKPVTNNKLSKLTLAEYTTLDFEFGFTPLLKNIKKPLFKNMKSVEKSPVFIVKDKKSTNKQFVGLSDNFNAINKILEYNYSALQKLNNINSNSSKKDLLSCVNDVEEMIDSMSLINKTNADMCRKSLKEIKTDIKSDKTKNQKEWKPWNENKLDDISTLHTLINAVHQTSIKDFKESISLAKNYDKSGLQTITAINRGGTVKAYNLSDDSQINGDIYRLLDILSLDRHDVELYLNNSMIVWSCKLLKHSVDVIINLDEKDRGIKIYYSEGHSEKGNRDRILYFSKVLKEFGFEVEVDIENIDKGIDVATYSMEASLNKDSGLTSKTDLAEIGAKIIKLFEYSINLDIKLENFDDMETEDVIDDFVDVFNFGEMDSNYDPRIDTLKQSAPMFMPKPSQNRIKEIVKNMNSILTDLGLDSIPNTVLNGEKYNINNSSENKNNELANFFQKDIDKYFNEPIEKAYIQGKIIVNKDGILVENKQYNGLENVLEILNKEKEEIANCAKLLNCLPAEKIDYDTLGKITIQNSDLDVKTGIIKLTTGEYLFIKVLTDNKDVIKYAQAEIVSYDKRTVLTDIRLKNILEKEGYQTGNIKIESKVEKENKVEHIEYPITNEVTFDIEEIYNEIGIEQFLKEIELWKQDIDALKTLGIDNGLKAKIAKLADKLYAEQKYFDAADIIYTAYNLGLVKHIDYNWSNIRKAEYDGTVFFYNSIAKHYPENKQLRKALEQTVEILDSSKLNGDFGKEIKTISDNLKNDVLRNNINEKNIYIVYKLFEYYPGKVLTQVRKGALSVEQAMMLFEAILPLYKEIIEQNIEFNDDIFLEFKKAALLVYPVKFDKEYKERKKCFDDFVDFLTDYIAKSKNNGLNYYKYVVEIAANVYRGNSYHSDEIFDENKYKENIQRKQDTIDILTKFQETSSVDYALFANDILKNIVSDETTLALLFKSLKDADWYEYELELNEDALNDEIQNLIVNNCSNLDMGYMCHYFYFENEDGEGSSYFTKSIIEKLINIYNNSGNNELKKSAAVALGEIYSVMYEYIDSNDIISIDELNNFYKQNDMNCFLAKNVSYVPNLYDVDSTAYGTNFSYDSTQRLTDKKISRIRLVDGGKKQLDYDFSITSLILRNDDKNFKIKEKAPIFVKTYKVQSYEDKEQLLDLAGMFDAVKQLLEKNNTTLKEMKNINFENATDKDLNVVVENLEGMIDSMVLISKDDADTCRKSLERIKTDIGRGEIKKQKNLNRWNEDNLSSIDTLHTLINAVHQTGIRDFKTVIRYRNREEDLNWQNLLKSEHKGTEIKAYNLSEKETVNPEIYKMINNLALDKHSVDLVFKDDMVVWSLQLLAHSVDVIVDFGNKDRGIKIYYNEGGDEESNKWRINYFADILNDFGFYVEKDFEGEVYGITASLDNNSGLTDKIDLADMATKIIQLFEYSINLDLKLEGVYTDPTYDYFGDTDHKSRVEGQIKGYADIFMKGEMPFNYNLHVSDIIYVEPFYMDKPSGSRIREFKTYMNSILESLGLEQIPEDILNGKTVYVPNGDEMKNGYGQAGRNFFQKDIDTYFNKPIEQAFIKGQIKLDANGKLSKNKNYNEDFEKMFEEQNEDALIKNAKIIKMIPEYDITYYDTGNSLGSLVARDCAIKLLNGDYLYIKEFVDSTGEIEYAQVELVTDSVRTILTDDKLKKILEYEGYKIENIKVNSNEKENRKNKIKEKIIDTNIPNRLIENTRITSKGNVEYFIADVSFDSDNVSEDTILFKEFTTPKDFSAIKNSGGVVTTAGGTLSHAAITTKELGKPSLIIDNCQWKQDESGKYLEVINYRPVGKKEIKNIDGFGVVETQEKEKEIIKIRHGDKVFMSAENGFIVKLSEDENLEEQETKIMEYMRILKQQKKSVWRKQIFEKMNVITNVASVSVAEILLFNTWDKIHNTKLPLTDKEKTELKDKIEGIKNNIYTNLEDQYSIDYYKQSEENDDIDNFVKEKDIISLDEINANQKNRFGGKTVELAKIMEELKEFEDINVVVPSGLGLSKNVPEEYFGSEFRNLNEKIQELINKNDKDEIEKINIFDAIENIMENNQNKDLEKYILKNIDENKFYAVRSSGIGEDGREYAFAGMGESVLNVKGSQIIAEIKNVWKSFYDKEAIEYMINTGQFIQPAILIQEMVDAAYAGVAFSRNEKGNLIINVTEGLGDKVVDGTVTPDEIEVNSITGEKINPNIETILTPEQIKELNNVIMFLEGNTGYPIDTEFAFSKDGKLNVLQRRADTKFNNIGMEQQADIKFDKIESGKELFYVEYKNKAVPVLVEFDKKYNQITFVVSDDNFNNEDKNNILVRIQDRVNNDIVVRGKVNRHIPIFNNIAQGKLEILPPVPVDNLEIIEDDFADIENSKNTINLLTAA